MERIYPEKHMLLVKLIREPEQKTPGGIYIVNPADRKQCTYRRAVVKHTGPNRKARRYLGKTVVIERWNDENEVLLMNRGEPSHLIHRRDIVAIVEEDQA